MSDPKTTTVDVNGFPCRVWTKGQGPRLGFLAGLGGLPRWLPFLDRLAETHTVIAPSLPGYPGATGHTELDTHLDWVLAVRQLVDKAGLAGADLVGASVGGAFAAEMAAIFPGHVRRLALIAPFGLFDDKDPPTDPWAQRAEGAAHLGFGLYVVRLVADLHRGHAEARNLPIGDGVEFVLHLRGMPR